jgi:Fe-S oxidoreductase
MGRLEQARSLMQHNAAQISQIGASRVVSTCPSCYHMWKHVYPDVLGQGFSSLEGLEVLHATELLDDLITEGALRLGELPLRVTYHDPCDLGRKSSVYDAPRRVLQSIPGVTLVEMSSAGPISECCGGGGNLESFDWEVVHEVSSRRVERAAEVLTAPPDESRREAGGHGGVLASACQQCERTLMGAARRQSGTRGTRLRVMDVAELVWSSMERAVVE